MNLTKYRYVFYAAALYNLVWGVMTILFPDWLFDLLNIPPPMYAPLWQVVGMFVLVFAPAYWWAARYPERHPHLILIGFLGKILGPIGFVWAAMTGQLPLIFGVTILTNDLIWWLPFLLYLRDVSRERGGFTTLLRGE